MLKTTTKLKLSNETCSNRTQVLLHLVLSIGVTILYIFLCVVTTKYTLLKRSFSASKNY